MRKLLSLEEALLKIDMLDLKPLGTEIVDIRDSLGRVLAEDVVAEVDFPHFRRATMDGYATKIENLPRGKEETRELLVKDYVKVGESRDLPVGEGECVKVDTGSPLPSDCDVVVPLEYTEKLDESKILVRGDFASMENVYEVGEDIRKGELIASRGTRVSAELQSTLITLGVKFLKVYRTPRVAIISLGDELMDVDGELVRGRIFESNSYSIASLVESCACKPFFLGIIEDDRDEIERALDLSLREFDCAITIGASSIGERDFLEDVISDFGEIVFHGVGIKPGKPTLLAICRNKVVLGLPGNPTSAYTSLLVIGRRILNKLSGLRDERVFMRGRLLRRIPLSTNRYRIVHLVAKTSRNGEIILFPLLRESGSVRSTELMNSICILKPGFGYVERNTEINFELLRMNLSARYSCGRYHPAISGFLSSLGVKHLLCSDSEARDSLKEGFCSLAIVKKSNSGSLAARIRDELVLIPGDRVDRISIPREILEESRKLELDGEIRPRSTFGSVYHDHVTHGYSAILTRAYASLYKLTHYVPLGVTYDLDILVEDDREFRELVARKLETLSRDCEKFSVRLEL